MELLHLCSMPTVGWAPSSITSRDYKLVGDQWHRGAVDPSLLVVARKRMAAPMSFYRKSRHIYYKIETKNLKFGPPGTRTWVSGAKLQSLNH